MKIIGTTGIGRSEKSNSPIKMIEKFELPYEIFDWQQYVEDISDPLRAFHTSYGSKGARTSRKLIYDYLFDATAYEETRDVILESLHELIIKQGIQDLTLCCHSWGCIVFYDYLKKYKPSNVVNFITLGCPIPMQKADNYTAIKGVNWINYYELNDGLAHMLNRPGIKDVNFESRHWLLKFNLLSHLSYFRSRRLAKMIMKEVL